MRRGGKGSHLDVKMPNGQLVTIPDHGRVKAGLLQAAVPKAGLKADGFLQLLGR